MWRAFLFLILFFLLGLIRNSVFLCAIRGTFEEDFDNCVFVHNNIISCSTK